MRKAIRKWFWAWDFDKEEKWLNEMSADGLQLVAVGWCKYIFDEGAPGEYIIRLELLDNLPGNSESTRYIDFLEDTGVQYLGSIFRWAYFRKKSSENGFDLFSDIESRIKHLNRILTVLGPICALNFYNAMNNLCQYFFTTEAEANLPIGILCGFVSLVLLYGFMQIYFKRRRLKRERALYE